MSFHFLEMCRFFKNYRTKHIDPNKKRRSHWSRNSRGYVGYSITCCRYQSKRNVEFKSDSNFGLLLTHTTRASCKWCTSSTVVTVCFGLYFLCSLRNGLSFAGDEICMLQIVAEEVCRFLKSLKILRKSTDVVGKPAEP